MQFTSLAVFCGSKSGADPVYISHAKELGHLMAQKNITLVYGGGGKGIMGAVADAVMDNNGKVVGVIPEILLEWEAHHQGITDLRVVSDMHVRKKMMYELCDAAVILAGGHGTLDELFEMLTWNTLKIHSKKIFLLNSNGYYTHLIEHMRHMYKEDFLYEEIEDRIVIVNEPSEVFA
ncbi:MAG: TIGR00730 family Rossman fold protein [Chitinophagaceae bacterium]|nr:TIGR00730 family Rossman fold protein [Chitinophagaceae bacterium]